MSLIKVIKLIAIVSFSVVAAGCTTVGDSKVEPVLDLSVGPQTCSSEWFTKVDDKIVTGDGQGHGPDLGSLEWRSVIEFRLGIRGDSSIPARNSEQWCEYIDTNFIKSS